MNLVENTDGQDVVTCDDCLDSLINSTGTLPSYWSSHKTECEVCGAEEDDC